MNSIVFICPYFGTIDKAQYKLWLKSCAANPSIDFLLITDDNAALSFKLPTNVLPVAMSWDECKALIQSQFDFKVALAYSYKLCDCKPAFGEIFHKYIADYDFWGHTDSGDTILGDLRRFLTDDILNAYDKIHIYGHLTLFRNTSENNARYTVPQRNGLTVRDIFTAQENMCFDDMYQSASINRIYKENGFPLLEQVPDLVADIMPDSYRFRLFQDGSKIIPRVFEWNNGKLFELTVVDGNVKRREIGYVHFQKRKIRNEVTDGSDHFYFVPNVLINADRELTTEDIVSYSKDKIYLEPLKGRVKRLSWYIRHPNAFKRKLKEKIFH